MNESNSCFNHPQTEDYSRWDVKHSGSLQIYEDGADGTDKSLLVVERTAVGSGFLVDLNSTCLVEGRRYTFEAKTKLFTEDGDPFNCTKSAGYADPQACPMFTIDFKNNGTNLASHYSNEDPSIYSSTTWNTFRTTFTVNHELAAADSASFRVHGPAVGIGIAIDRVSFNEYVPPAANCDQMVLNGNAEVSNM